MPWASVLEKVVRVQSSQQLCVVKDLSAHDIVMRLMRKENYVIGMINKGVLAFPISKWIPGAGPRVKSGPYRRHRRLMLTKTLEWTLNWCILQSMFDRWLMPCCPCDYLATLSPPLRGCLPYLFLQPCMYVCTGGCVITCCVLFTFCSFFLGGVLGESSMSTVLIVKHLSFLFRIFRFCFLMLPVT